MKSKILFTCLIIVAIGSAISGYSRSMTDKPIIFERAHFALYDGMIYYQYNYGYVSMGESLVNFKSFRSLISNEVVIIFKADKSRPIFSMVHMPGPNLAKDSVGWVDDNCDGKFRPLTMTDKAGVPKCHKLED